MLWTVLLVLIGNVLADPVAPGYSPGYYNCEEAATAVQTWLVVLIVVPTILNLCSVGLLVFSMILIGRLKGVVEAISSSTHWLTRTAIRVGLGPTAKKALIEYAKTKPEFKKLLG
uniref:Uncharacterized protein n=1 Tax=Panagrolaimus sp. JU765 TaxID=591449 RepID=A0AC34RPF7_9BILA